MLKIAIVSEKGGLGKTTIAYHLAARAAEEGDRSVMIDADPQGSLSTFFGLPNNPGLYDILVRGENFQEHLYKVPTEVYTRQAASGQLNIIPGNTETRLINQSDQYSRLILADMFEDMEEAGQMGISTVIVDTGPSPSEWHNAVYAAVDAVVIPFICEPLGVAGLYNTLAHLQKANKIRGKDGRSPLRILAVVPNMHRPNTSLHKVQLEEVKETLAPHNITIVKPIELRVVWGDATRAQKTIYAHEPESDSAIQMAALASDLLRQERVYV